MSGGGTRRRLATTSVLALLVAGACGGDGKDLDGERAGGGRAGADATVDAAAPAPSAEQVRAAATRLAEATSFRLEGTAQKTAPDAPPQAQRVQMTFQAPSTLHVRFLSLADGTLQQEFWLTADKAYRQEPPQPDGTRAPARCATSSELGTTDPRRLLREIAKVERATPAEEGGAAFDLTPEAANIAFAPPQEGTYSKVKGRATVVGDVLALVRIEAEHGPAKLDATFLYADVGAAPEIQLPQADC